MKARFAVSLAFFVNGACFACLACRMPDLQRTLKLDEAQLGFAFLACAFGAFLGVATAGHVCARLGSRKVTILGGILSPLFLALLSFTPNLWTFISIFLVFGFSTATMDVAMNVNGVAVEKQFGKPIMSSLHGMFSLGGMIWAGIGWLIVKLQIPVQTHFVGASLVLIAITLGIAPRMLESAPASSQVVPAFVLPHRSVVVIGIICFCAFICEGAMGDWSAIYLRKELNQAADFSTLGYFGFTLAMTLTRFWGDSVLHRWGPSATLRMCGLITASGMALALLVGSPFLTILGFISVGFGMATVAPIAFSVGGKIGGDNPDHAISSIATMGYMGFLVGPALIGFLAKAWSLREALGLVVVLSIAIVLLSRFAVPRQVESQP